MRSNADHQTEFADKDPIGIPPAERPLAAEASAQIARRPQLRRVSESGPVAGTFRRSRFQNRRAIVPPRCLAGFMILLLPACLALSAEPQTARVHEIAAMLPPKPAGFGRPITDRAAWARLAANQEFAALPRTSARLVSEGLSAQPDELFLDYSKTGNRDRWQKVAFDRRGRVATFTLAECVEDKGRFLKPLEETITALCAEKTWVMPAHDGGLKNFKGEIVEMDLGSTMLSWDLATSDWLLGDKLSPATRALIREHLTRRTFTPFRDMLAGRQHEAFWIRATHNWNAVCLGGTVGSALAILDRPEDRAWFAAAAEEHIKRFLAGFTADGYCSEGLGYWNYGFGYFAMLSETLRQTTEGKLDLLADPAARMPALFAVRAEILNGIYPSIADCSPGSQPDAKLMHYLSGRLQLNEPRWREVDPVGAGRSLCSSAMYSFLPSTTSPIAVAASDTAVGLRTWFKDGGVLICRPAPGGKAFAACLKGGHNAEHHNHNDVGSFSVVCGRTMVLCDPGSEVHTARTFSGKRYDSKVLSSYGHAVPVVAGRLQRSGGDARAIVKQADFAAHRDVLDLDVRSAYDVPELKQLGRQFVFERGPKPSLTVRDEMASANPVAFESAIITWSEWKRLSPDEWLVGKGTDAVHVRVDTGGLAFDVSEDVLREDVHTPELPRRFAVRLKEPATNVRLSFAITPGE